MHSREIGSVISYTVDVLSRVSGLEAFRQTRKDAINSGNTNLVATLKGAREGIGKILLPNMTNNIARPSFMDFVNDFCIGVGVPIFIMAENPDSVAGSIGARVIYNVALEVVPDALRAIRRREDPVLRALNSLVGD